MASKRTADKTLQALLASAIKNARSSGDSVPEIEHACRFVAAAFYYRDFPTVEEIVRRENDNCITEAVHQAMDAAGLRGAK